MIHISDKIYEALANELIAKIDGKDYFDTFIEIEDDGIYYDLKASGYVFWRDISNPEGMTDEISDIIPTWWELHTFDKDGNEIRNNGQFSEIREHIIDYGKSW